MHTVRPPLFSALSGLVLAGVLALPGAAQARGEQPGVFDYYALSLSWSPDYCATRGKDDEDQCATGRQLGFVLHGLWPQFVNGYPESCSRMPLPGKLKAEYAPLYPSPRLIEHEWKKHGTCSGLTPAAYLALSAKLKQGLTIPAPYQKPAQPLRTTATELQQAFRAANPGLQDASLLPFCSGSGRFLREVRVCYRKDGVPQSCGAAEIKRSQKSCGQPSFLLQSVR
ncbi:ribonuclease [Massilia sp. erpn]|uniref:ribonuclease T2 family protein n=1 Tax=Massilia sp. erpn TaxID=2738142 RepID=UPI0021073FB9|nr:ribonuclease [Massilia sp. erpn]UTY58832.1 ribonuclease [Massilia sp. erpn]